MKILITGGRGFIGSHVADNLRARGIEVLSFDHHLLNVNFDGEDQFLGDVRDYTAVSEAVAVVDGVIHLAGILGTQETIKEPLPAVETNILGSLNIFKACEHYGKKAVYIAVGNHWMNNSYSITKTTAERFAFMFNRERGTKIAVVRGLNAYGPRQKIGPVRKITPNFIMPALKGEAITIYGDGTQVMDMIYVEDLAEILVRALLLEHGVYDRVFDAGTGRPTTVKEIAEEVIRQIGSGSLNFAPMRPGEPSGSVVLADTATLAPLGEIKFTPLEEGIKRTIEWYRSLYPHA
ncbi:MAG: NAD-dependent epimerase/dehydratase family protein [Patescibacteria group bacterium]|nr:NAD-dependent epimerase/dehydratase family protein [Patescibacteria group bacterium]